MPRQWPCNMVMNGSQSSSLSRASAIHSFKALSRTSPPTPESAPVSGPRADGENRASGSAAACVAFGANFVCRLDSFFAKPVRDFSQFLGYVEPVDHRLAVLQARCAGRQEGCPHVRVMELNRVP